MPGRDFDFSEINRQYYQYVAKKGLNLYDNEELSNRCSLMLGCLLISMELRGIRHQDREPTLKGILRDAQKYFESMKKKEPKEKRDLDKWIEEVSSK